MKHFVLRSIPISFMLFVNSTGLFAQDLTVGGAGSSAVNGGYNHTFTYAGKNAYESSSNDILWWYSEWRFTDRSGNGRWYYNTANTALPPSGGWQVDGGTGPAPTLTGDIYLLPPAGSGTSDDPYLIANLSDLYWLTQTSSEWGKAFKQTADIDASSTSAWESGAGFSPIGNADGIMFSGSYDGQGHSITGISINRSTTDYVAFFGCAEGTIKNTILEIPNISGRSCTGGLIGYSGGATVTNCAVIGGNVGGAMGTAGGLIGGQNGGCTSRCFSTASVSAVAYNGGLIGETSGDEATCTDCYSTGSISGAVPYNGGLIGIMMGGMISNCYSSGAVTAEGVGGSVGNFSSGTLSNCFWDTAASGVGTGFGTGSTSGLMGIDTLLMKKDSVFLAAGWSGAIWNIDAGINNGYPYLRWQNPCGTPLPVELSSFTATASNLAAMLSWKTATEVNNAGFDVERKTINNEQPTMNSWAKIGFVGGHGTSNTLHNYSYTDNVGTAGKCSYRLKQIDHNGAFTYSQEVTVQVGAAPKVFGLAQNYPNPFNPATTMQFSVPSDGRATLNVFNALGQKVATLFEGVARAGEYHQATFDGSRFASGIYFARLEFGGQTLVKKLLMVK